MGPSAERGPATRPCSKRAATRSSFYRAYDAQSNGVPTLRISPPEREGGGPSVPLDQPTTTPCASSFPSAGGPHRASRHRRRDDDPRHARRAVPLRRRLGEHGDAERHIIDSEYLPRCTHASGPLGPEASQERHHPRRRDPIGLLDRDGVGGHQPEGDREQGDTSESAPGDLRPPVPPQRSGAAPAPADDGEEHRAHRQGDQQPLLCRHHLWVAGGRPGAGLQRARGPHGPELRVRAAGGRAPRRQRRRRAHHQSALERGVGPVAPVRDPPQQHPARLDRGGPRNAGEHGRRRQRGRREGGRRAPDRPRARADRPALPAPATPSTARSESRASGAPTARTALRSATRTSSTRGRASRTGTPPPATTSKAETARTAPRR